MHLSEGAIVAALQQAVERHLEYTTELRHSLHRVPELSLEEHETSALIEAELDNAGLDVKERVGETGLIADLDTGRPGGYTMLRADMDGLPVAENSGVPYFSLHPGISHCCGHDGNAACLLGAARVLGDMRDQLQGRIRFVFQPAEETSLGALAMINSGLYQDGLPDGVFALHGWPGIPVGAVGGRAGTLMAAANFFSIVVIGQGGHGARPQHARNPIVGLMRVAEALTSMNTAERVVSPCVVRVGNKANVIADTGRIEGTVRTLDEATRQASLGEIRERCEKACAEVGMQVEVNFGAGCPRVASSQEMYAFFNQVATRVLGKENVVDVPSPSMGSEDFGYYLERGPGLMFRLGLGEGAPELHNPRFDFLDDALPSGILLMSALAAFTCNQEK